MSYFLIGIAPDHRPALVAGLLVPLAWALVARLVLAHAAAGHGRAVRVRVRWATCDAPTRWAVWLLVTAAVVHLALPLGHAGPPALTVAFLGSGAGFGWLAWRAVAGRRWRAGAALLLGSTLVGYLVAIGLGEEPDQVGTATALVELTALGFCLTPPYDPHRTLHRVVLRPLASTGLFAGTLLVGVAIWAVFLAGHDRVPDAEQAPAQAIGAGGGGHGHAGYLARAQAGILMRPGGRPPSAAQVRAATELARRTESATRRYRDYHRAIADGYRPAGPLSGLQVHFDSAARRSDGRVLAPDAPEQLVYAVDNGRIALIGVVFQMPRAGQPGPAVGGSTTRWHAHNLCVTVLPPGFGAVSPFGGCPFTGVTVTIPEMMHLWLHDPPGGAYVDKPPDAWIRDLLVREGEPL